MRTTSITVTAALACLAMGATVAGCSDGTGAEDPSAPKEPSARQVLDAANDAMKALTSVTIDGDTIVTGGEDFSTHITTDLQERCTSKTTWATGPSLEQIRIGGTDYVRTNRAYLERWSGRDVTDVQDQDRWTEAPTSEAKEGDGLAKCTWPFVSFGVAKKREPTEVDGSPAIRLLVTDEADEGGTYTFYVATEGEPYILKVVYEGAEYHSITRFSAFDEPRDVRPPAEADIVDAGDDEG